MEAPKSKRMVRAIYLIIAMVLSACVNVNQVVQDARVVNSFEEKISSLSLLFVTPRVNSAGSSDPNLLLGYQLSGVLNPANMVRAGYRVAELFEKNDLVTQYSGAVDSSVIQAQILRSLAYHSHVLIFFPVGSNVTTQNGAPVSGATRYRIQLIDNRGRILIEFYDNFTTSVATSLGLDQRAIAWFNTLAQFKAAMRPGEGIRELPFRDYVKEQRGGDPVSDQMRGIK